MKPSGRALLSPGIAPRCSRPFCSQLALLCTGRLKGAQKHSGHKAVLLPKGCCVHCRERPVCSVGTGRSCPHSLPPPPLQLRANSRTLTSIQHSNPTNLSVPPLPLLLERLSAHANLLPYTELGTTRAAPNVLVPAPAAETRSVLSGFNPAVSLLTPLAPFLAPVLGSPNPHSVTKASCGRLARYSSPQVLRCETLPWSVRG